MINNWDAGNMKGYRLYVDDHGEVEDHVTLVYSFYNNVYNVKEMQYKPKFGSAGELEFKLPYESALQLMPRLTKGTSSFDDTFRYENLAYEQDVIIPMSTSFLLYYGDEVIFVGRAIKTKMDINGLYTINVEGALNYLCDVVIEPFDLKQKTLREFITYILDEYNSKCDWWKMIKVDGNHLKIDLPEVPNYEENKKRDYKSTEFVSAADVLKKYVTDVFGGYFCLNIHHIENKDPEIEKKSNIEFGLDYVNFYSYGINEDPQVIYFTKNMLELNKSIDATKMINTLYPVGATIDVSDIRAYDDIVNEETGEVVGEKPMTYKLYDRFEYESFKDKKKKHTFELIDPAVKNATDYPGYLLRTQYFNKYYPGITPDYKDHRLPSAEECQIYFMLENYGFEYLGTHDELKDELIAERSKGVEDEEELQKIKEQAEEDINTDFDEKKESGEIKEFTGNEWISMYNIVWANAYHQVEKDDGTKSWEKAVIYYSYEGSPLFNPINSWMNQFMFNRFRDLGATDELDGIQKKYTLDYVKPINYRGTYDINRVTYYVDDSVTYDGNSLEESKTYICIKQCVSNSIDVPSNNPTNWKLLFDTGLPINKERYTEPTKDLKWEDMSWGYLMDVEMSHKYGVVSAVKEWSDVTSRDELLKVGSEYLTSLSSLPPNLEINAYDLSLNSNEIPIKIGHMQPVMSRVHGLIDYMWGIGSANIMSTSYLVKSATIDIIEPSKSKYVLGNSEDGIAEKFGKVYK